MPDVHANLKGPALTAAAKSGNYESIRNEEVRDSTPVDHEVHLHPNDDKRTDSRESLTRRRSRIAHSLLCQQSPAELPRKEPDAGANVQHVIAASLTVNVFVATAMAYAAFTSGSLAVLSSLVDSVLDLTSQWLFWYADKHMHTPHEHYPAGRRRLEPVAVVISATLMGMASVEVIDKSIETLVEGFDGMLPDLDMQPLAVGILLSAIAIKIVLWRLCSRIAKTSPSADALAQDHRNDILSNSIAIATSLIAHHHRKLWYLDPIGAIVISVYIGLSWLATGNEQVERLIGIRADPDFIQHLQNLTDLHHPLMKSDVVRAYHFGNHYLVELEVVLPAEMSVREAHDIVLELQTKVEELDNVERAFVHVDYMARGYDEHKDPTLRRSSSLSL